jgi:hypothetical protein
MKRKMNEIRMSFDVDVAKAVGTDCAIILSNIQFWEFTNRANNRNFHDGRYWTYNSTKAFSKIFSYLSTSQIRRCLDKLESNGYLVSGNYNKAKYDRTKWYSPNYSAILRNRQMDLTKSSNGVDETVKPIPDINTDDKPNIKQEEKEKFGNLPSGDEAIYNKLFN